MPIKFVTLNKKLKTTTLLFALVAKPSEGRVIRAFFNAQQLFPNIAFELLAYRDFKDRFPSVPPSPVLAIYANGSLISVQGPVDSELALAHLLDLRATQSRPTVDSLNGSLNGASLTVIARPSHFTLVSNFSLTGSVPTNVVIISEKVATALNFSDSDCGVFHSDDSHLSAFNCTFENYQTHSRPLYSTLKDKTLKEQGLFVAFHLDEPEEVAINFLSNVSARYPSFNFVYVPYREAFLITNIMTDPFAASHVNLGIFNFTGKCHYDLSTYLTPVVTEKFDFAVWESLIGRILADFQEGKLRPIYLSEYESPRTLGSLQRISGSNFEKFVNNASADVFMLFQKTKCVTCPVVYNDYRQFVSKIEKTGVPYEFGYIDAGNNAIPGGFPVKTVPAIALYPANDKSNVRIAPLESYDVIAWFANQFASRKHTVEFQPVNNATLGEVATRVSELTKRVSPELAEGLRVALQELKNTVTLEKRVDL